MKPYIILDIDGTLLDNSYRINDTGLRKYIDDLTQNGYLFGINSNRALEDLLPVAEKFAIRGPIIGEDGLFVYYPKSEKIEYFDGKSKLKQLQEEKTILEKQLYEVLKQNFPKKNVVWINTDTVEEIIHPHMVYEEGSIVVLNNQFRKYTVSAHLKMWDGKKLQSMRKEVRSISEDLSNTLSSDSSFRISFSPDFANILASAKFASKKKATENLLIRLQESRKLYVIGDELNDYLMAKDLGTFLTVANASPSVKAKASISANKSYAAGVHELLCGLTT